MVVVGLVVLVVRVVCIVLLESRGCFGGAEVGNSRGGEAGERKEGEEGVLAACLAVVVVVGDCECLGWGEWRGGVLAAVVENGVADCW